MFELLFSSKNHKLVKKWVKEHEDIVILAHKIIAEYSLNNHTAARKYLVQLNRLAVNHLMIEDIELFKLLREKKKLDEKTEKLAKEFQDGFMTTKIALMDFLTKYSKPNVVLDDVFFKSFNDIVGVLAERIDFEEKNLYSSLDVE